MDLANYWFDESGGDLWHKTFTDGSSTILNTARASMPNALYWIKSRSSANDHQFIDPSRGGNLALPCPTVLNEGEKNYVTPPGANSVCWAWKAGENVVTNNAGNIPAQVRVNQEAGFSIITYTGTGSNTGTVGHGLSQAPQFVVQKKRNANATGDGWDEWNCYHRSLPNAGYGIRLNSNGNAFQNDFFWNRVAPNASNIRLGYGGGAGTNGSSNNVIYAWHAVPGYSFFGSYTGNGSTNGPALNLGFRPAFVMIKGLDSGKSWEIKDDQRSQTDPRRARLWSDLRDPESQGVDIEFLDNGFKIRESGTATNQLNITYIYCAFANRA